MAKAKVYHRRQSDEWTTPLSLFDPWHARIGFDLDAAATAVNRLTPAWLGPGSPLATDALTTDWAVWGTRIWCNPPYSRLPEFLAKAHDAKVAGAQVVLLIPARTDTKAWHRYVWDRAAASPRPGVTVHFLPGRVKFGEAKAGAPFPSCVIDMHGCGALQY